MPSRFTRAEVLSLLAGGSALALAPRGLAATSARPSDPERHTVSSNFSVPEYSILDAQVRPGEREAIVRVRRNGPTYFSLAMRFAVANGRGGATSPHHFPPDQRGEFVFDYDVDEIQIPVKLSRDLAPGQTVVVALNTPRAYGDLVEPTDQNKSAGELKVVFARPSAVISTVEAETPPLPSGAVSRRWNQPIKRSVPEGWTRAFYSNLIDGFEANDAGRRADGAPCFRSSLAHGRMQDNGEVGLYADPVVYPQTNPYQIIGGKRALVTEKLPAPVPYKINGKTKLPTHTSPIVTTETMPRFGYGRFSYKFALPAPTIGMWPAGWQLSLPHWRWPDPEHDTVEISFPKPEPRDIVPYQTHWWGRPGKRGFKQGQFANVHELIPGFKYSDQHEYWCDWTPEVMRWGIDDMLTFSAPNRYFLKDPRSQSDPNRLYMILQIAIGGAGGDPQKGSYPSAMIVDHIAHYAMPPA